MCLCAVAAHYVSYTYVAVIITRLMRGDGLLVTALTVFGVAGTAGTLSVGLHNDRHPRAGIVLATGTYSAGVAALCGATVLGSPVWRAASILTAMTLCGVGYGSFGPVSQAGVIRAAPSRQDVASSYYVTTFQVAIAAGSGLGALVVDHGPTGALPVVTLSMMGPVAVAAVVLRHAYGASQAGSDAPAAAEGPTGVRPR
jgi:predicted MFS family arabinose efflux permease